MHCPKLDLSKLKIFNNGDSTNKPSINIITYFFIWFLTKDIFGQCCNE